MISIITPTLNEEKYLPCLLESIKNQDYQGELEIIVADAGSKDKTREIAEKFGCKIVQGGLPGKGRNEGAKKAKGELLFFVDADILLPKDFLNKATKEFLNRDLDAGSFFFQFIDQRFWQKIFVDVFYKYPVKIFLRIWPVGSMVFLVKKGVHQEIHGFDEKVIFLEDVDYARRLSKRHRYGFIESTKTLASPRRLKTDGIIMPYLKCIFGNLYMVFFGPIKKDIFKYKFNHYD